MSNRLITHQKSLECCKFLKCRSSVCKNLTLSRASTEYFVRSILAPSKFSMTGFRASRRTESMNWTSGRLSCSSSAARAALRSRQSSISAMGPSPCGCIASCSSTAMRRIQNNLFNFPRKVKSKLESVPLRTWFCQFETVFSSSSITSLSCASFSIGSVWYA